MRILATLVLGVLIASAIFAVAMVLLVKKGGWELERYDREQHL